MKPGEQYWLDPDAGFERSEVHDARSARRAGAEDRMWAEIEAEREMRRPEPKCKTCGDSRRVQDPARRPANGFYGYVLPCPDCQGVTK